MMPNDNQILENILKTHLCSMDIFNNDYERFLKTRTQLLINKARELCL
jgi:hypothetical protein